MEQKELLTKILSANTCGDIFRKGSLSEIRDQYYEIAKSIHPDICSLPEAEKAFSILTRLRNDALTHIKNGTWGKTGQLFLNDTYTIDYRNEKPFEFGTRYSGMDQIVFAFDQDKEKWANLFQQKIHAFSFLDKAMTGMYKDRIPRIEKTITMNDKRRVIILKKNPNEYPMDLFLSAYRGKIGGRDIAWMISRMVDLCCLLYVNGFVHNGIEVENLYICPKDHYICLYGGWQYATRIGEKMTGAKKSVYDLMPTSAKTSKKATPITDMECVRDIFINVVKDYCDPTKCVPLQIEKWINAGSTSDPISEYEHWNQVLDKAYGQRKFQVFSANADEIYSKH